jgi:hypothetical protein
MECAKCKTSMEGANCKSCHKPMECADGMCKCAACSNEVAMAEAVCDKCMSM